MGTVEPTAAGRGRGRGSGVTAALVGILVVAVAVWIVLAALDDSAGPERGVTLEQVADEPDELEGRSVTVSGELAEFVVPGRAFPLGEGFGDTVLVVPASGTRVPPLEEDDVLQVTGVFTRASSRLSSTTRPTSQSRTRSSIPSTGGR